MNASFQAMILKKQKTPLVPGRLELPPLKDNEILIKVEACAVCRTDLHVIDADLKDPVLPLVPGHEIVGKVKDCASTVQSFEAGDRVAVAWLASTCLACKFCLQSRENLCPNACFTGYNKHGGYAEYAIADARFAFKIPEQYANYKDTEIAPLLCAGLIGWRCFKMAAGASGLEAKGRRLGIYGFGAAGHLVLQLANYFNWQVYAFTRERDKESQELALKLGAVWAAGSTQAPPEKLDAAIIFAPVGALVPLALAGLERGGVLVLGGIHMSDIPQFPYELIWGERSICSVANLTRQDGHEFLELAGKIPIKPQVKIYELGEANQALTDLREGNLTGAAVLSIS